MQLPTNVRGYRELDRKYVHTQCENVGDVTGMCAGLHNDIIIQARPGHEQQDVPYIVNRGNPTKETDYGLLNFIYFCIQIIFDLNQRSQPLFNPIRKQSLFSRQTIRYLHTYDTVLGGVDICKWNVNPKAIYKIYKLGTLLVLCTYECTYEPKST